MTNIRPNQTMENLQQEAHQHIHTIVLKHNGVDKAFWQKVWIIERFVRAMGFVKVMRK